MAGFREIESMYKLYRTGSASDPDALWLDYEWGPTFDNTEWRPCVDHFMNEVATLGHDVVAVIPRATFRRGEDFVEIEYLLNGNRISFSSDHLLCLIDIKPEDPSVIRSVWNALGAKLGWIG